jgi:hypothetical protein
VLVFGVKNQPGGADFPLLDTLGIKVGRKTGLECASSPCGARL